MENLNKSIGQELEQLTIKTAAAKALQRIKRPLLFVIFPLICLSLLLFLLGKKTSFDQTRERLIVIVADNDQSVSDEKLKENKINKAGNLLTAITGQHTDQCWKKETVAQDDLGKAKTAIICASVNDILYQNFKDPNQLSAVLRTSISDKISALKTDDKYKDKIESLKLEFVPVYKNIYNLRQNGGLYFDSPTNPWEELFYDSNGGLYIVYQLIMLALTAVIVFSLLYLILILLKNIFFLAAATDAVTDYATRLLEKSGTGKVDAGGLLVRSLLTTVTVAGIGTAVVLSTQIPVIADQKSPFAEQKNPANGAPDKREDPADPDNRIKNPYLNPTPVPDQLSLSQLADKIDKLSEDVGKLNDKTRNPAVEFRNVPFPVVSEEFMNTTLPAFSRNITTLNGEFIKLRDLVGNPNQGASAKALTNTLFGNVESIKNDYQSFSESTTNNFAEVNKILGKPSAPLDRTTVLGKLNGISTDTNNLSTALGIDNFLVKKTTLFSEVSKVSNNINAISETVLIIDSNTTDIGGYVLGTSGKNILRQTKSLFSDQRYKITLFAVNELERGNLSNDPELESIIGALKLLLPDLNNRHLSADDLFKNLSRFSEPNKKPYVSREIWKRWKSVVLRSMRVSRY